MKVFCSYLKDALLEKFSLNVDAFVSEKRSMGILRLKYEFQTF